MKKKIVLGLAGVMLFGSIATFDGNLSAAPLAELFASETDATDTDADCATDTDADCATDTDADYATDTDADEEFATDTDADEDDAKPTVAKSQKIKVATKLVKVSSKKAKSFKIKASAKTGLIFKKVSGHKKITVTKTGKVTVKKGLKKGKTYTLKVDISAKKTANYKAAKKTASIKIKVAK